MSTSDNMDIDPAWDLGELVGSFPVEPAPGSPEAVAQAAETIRNEPGFPWLAAGTLSDFAKLHPDPDNPDEPAFCRWCDRPAVILNSVCGKPACAYHEDDSSAPHAIPYAAIVRQRDRLREQRDELADVLKTVRQLFPDEYQTGAHRHYDADYLSGNELAYLDELLRKVGRS